MERLIKGCQPFLKSSRWYRFSTWEGFGSDPRQLSQSFGSSGAANETDNSPRNVPYSYLSKQGILDTAVGPVLASLVSPVGVPANTQLERHPHTTRRRSTEQTISPSPSSAAKKPPGSMPRCVESVLLPAACISVTARLSTEVQCDFAFVFASTICWE